MQRYLQRPMRKEYFVVVFMGDFPLCRSLSFFLSFHLNIRRVRILYMYF